MTQIEFYVSKFSLVGDRLHVSGEADIHVGEAAVKRMPYAVHDPIRWLG